MAHEEENINETHPLQEPQMSGMAHEEENINEVHPLQEPEMSGMAHEEENINEQRVIVAPLHIEELQPQTSIEVQGDVNGAGSENRTQEANIQAGAGGVAARLLSGSIKILACVSYLSVACVVGLGFLGQGIPNFDANEGIPNLSATEKILIIGGIGSSALAGVLAVILSFVSSS